jgi:hypothetical protein
VPCFGIFIAGDGFLGMEAQCINCNFQEIKAQLQIVLKGFDLGINLVISQGWPVTKPWQEVMAWCLDALKVKKSNPIIRL